MTPLNGLQYERGSTMAAGPCRERRSQSSVECPEFQGCFDTPKGPMALLAPIQCEACENRGLALREDIIRIRQRETAKSEELNQIDDFAKMWMMFPAV